MNQILTLIDFKIGYGYYMPAGPINGTVSWIKSTVWMVSWYSIMWQMELDHGE